MPAHFFSTLGVALRITIYEIIQGIISPSIGERLSKYWTKSPVEMCKILAEYGNPFLNFKRLGHKDGKLFCPWGQSNIGKPWEYFRKKLLELKPGNFIKIRVANLNGHDGTEHHYSSGSAYFTRKYCFESHMIYLIAKISFENEVPVFIKIRINGRCPEQDNSIFYFDDNRIPTEINIWKINITNSERTDLNCKIRALKAKINHAEDLSK